MKIAEMQEEEQEQKVKGPSEASASSYREMLDVLVLGIDWDDLDTNGKCMTLQDVLIQAFLLTAKPLKTTKAKFYGNKTINRLGSKCLECEALVNHLEQEQRNNSINDANIHLLNNMRREAGLLRLNLNDKILSRRRHRRSRIRSTTKPSSKQFWNLARREVKKAGSLSAIKDLQGNLATERQTIINIVLDELAIIFSGEQSTIFRSRNEQIVKELVTKQSEAWKPWIHKEAEPLAHEAVVCRDVTQNDVTEVIKTL